MTQQESASPSGLGLRRKADFLQSTPAPGGPPRIAFFTDTFAPTHDGVARITTDLAAVLAGRGIDVTVFTVRAPGQRWRETRSDGVRVRRHVSLSAPSYPEYRVALFPYSSVRRTRNRFDVVHIHTPGFVGLAGLLAARHWRVPSIGTYHSDLAGMLAGAGRSRPSRWFLRAWSRFNLWLCWACDVVTAPTVRSAEQLEQARPRQGARGPIVIENGVDGSRFHRDAPGVDWHSRLGIPTSRPLVTFLGRLTHDKGAPRFLDSAERIPADVPCFVVVGGTGPLEKEVAARFQPNGGLSGRGAYVGAVREEEKPALFAQTRVFVLPSFSDTSSVALLEAMACGAACVVTDRGGPAEIARRSGASLIVDPEDREGLARAIGDLLRDPERASQMGARGAAWVREEASIERTATSFDRLYRSFRSATEASSKSQDPGTDLQTRPVRSPEPGSR
jgi:glycosyltransferase involved in cell wall biosynthesis